MDKFSYSLEKQTLHFKQPAGTSRGTYLTRDSYFVRISDNETNVCGIGECATLPDLSCDVLPGTYEQTLDAFCRDACKKGELDHDALEPYPSMRFGLETAFAQVAAGGSTALFDTPFARGEEGILINGLIWMGSYGEMKSRLEGKLADGFHCVKLKIGAIDFESEMALVRQIRKDFSVEDVELRVDANGAFSEKDVFKKLDEIAKYDIHSIEQPVRQGQWKLMNEVCRNAPLPIALDEELIGINNLKEKEALLDTIRPQYIVLKPSLHGGMKGCQEWIESAKKRGIKSWITSALESNVGLNAIAHFTAKTYGPNITMPQGLGTGLLFSDNIPMPIEIRGERLFYNRK